MRFFLQLHNEDFEEDCADFDYAETDDLYCDLHHSHHSRHHGQSRNLDDDLEDDEVDCGGAGSPPDYDDVAVSSSGNEDQNTYQVLPLTPHHHHHHCCPGKKQRKSIVMNPVPDNMEKDCNVIFATDRVSPEGNNDSDGTVIYGNSSGNSATGGTQWVTFQFA